MDPHDYLALWCAGGVAVALVGYGRSLAGTTRAGRTVRTAGRVTRVREPRHGGSRKDGIPVVITFRDPSTGEGFTVTNDRGHGESITVAWVGRELGVHYPRGRPHAYRLTNGPHDEDADDRGRTVPHCAVLLVYAGLVAVAAVEWGWPWALIATCGPLAVLLAGHLPANLRAVRRRRTETTAMVTARARVVAVLKDTDTDGEGTTFTTWTPVLAFTTREGTEVTAHCPSAVSDRADSHGRYFTVHHAPTDPARFTTDPAAEHRSHTWDTALHLLALFLTAAGAAAGTVLL
ncbi:DUF3592 domain-containing protein [Streptomyces sp. NPDC049906]|uniref:DUF3592 domain-containing protein n=1 Tax=Streptomyces sp. NPDC049906 TaxID=3155656 RepID=UPI003449FE6E